MRVRWLISLVLGLGPAALGGCGGSSSETPPPLRPLPPNVHYNRSATTLPGELGTPQADERKTETSPAGSAKPQNPPE
jgi:hypothetical protein